MANEGNSRLTRRGLRLIVEPLESRRLLAALAAIPCDTESSMLAADGNSISGHENSEHSSASSVWNAVSTEETSIEPTAADSAQLEIEGEESLTTDAGYGAALNQGYAETTQIASDFYESLLLETHSPAPLDQQMESDIVPPDITDTIIDDFQYSTDEPLSNAQAAGSTEMATGNTSGQAMEAGGITNAANGNLLGGGTISIGDPNETVSPIRNPANPNDVNGDGFVSPIDVLIIINFINAQNAGSTLAAGESTSIWPDASGDGFISPIDVLLVINQLNEQSRIPEAGGSTLGGGEGEFAPTMPQNDFFAAEDLLRQRKRDLQVDAELVEVLDQLSRDVSLQA